MAALKRCALSMRAVLASALPQRNVAPSAAATGATRSGAWNSSHQRAVAPATTVAYSHRLVSWMTPQTSGALTRAASASSAFDPGRTPST